MWMTTEAIRYGRLAGAGSGTQGNSKAPAAAEPSVTSTVSWNLSSLDLMTAFQVACSTAANRTTAIHESGMAVCSPFAERSATPSCAVDSLGTPVIAFPQRHSMRIIDADGHVQDKNLPWRDLLPKAFAARAPHVVKDNRGIEFIMMEGRLCPKPVGRACSFVGAPRNRKQQETTGMEDPVQRLKDMDLEGIDTAVLFGTSPFLSLPFVEDKELAAAISEVYNNWLADYCHADPRRLKGVALVPIQDPPAAVKELRRAVKELGFVAVSTPVHSSSGKN